MLSTDRRIVSAPIYVLCVLYGLNFQRLVTLILNSLGAFFFSPLIENWYKVGSTLHGSLRPCIDFDYLGFVSSLSLELVFLLELTAMKISIGHRSPT